MKVSSSTLVKYQGTSSGNFTSFAGLPLFLEMSNISGLTDALVRNMQLKIQGWPDYEIISSLLLLNIAGGECVDDIDKLELDQGLNKILIDQECKGMSRQEKRAYQRRFRKEKKERLLLLPPSDAI